jgi:hypothetical protein
MINLPQELLDLRQQLYQTMADYHRANSVYWSARTKHGAQNLGPLLQSIDVAATHFTDALAAFLRYLQRLEPTPDIDQEIKRIKRLEELLRWEIALNYRGIEPQ